jgi:hypothetical protein
VAGVEEQIIAEGVEIIWLLEQDSFARDGTAQACRSFMRSMGSDKGLCVGDGQTEPMPGVFDNSMFAIGRGFDMVVRRSDMKIIFTASHGTPRGNQNLTGAQLLAEIRRLLGR